MGSTEEWLELERHLRIYIYVNLLSPTAESKVMLPVEPLRERMLICNLNKKSSPGAWIPANLEFLRVKHGEFRSKDSQTNYRHPPVIW